MYQNEWQQRSHDDLSAGRAYKRHSHQQTIPRRRRISVTEKIRMSLAYRHLEQIPPKILNYISENIEILDLSYNGLKDLSFLSRFESLQTLVLDRNCSLDCSTLPFLENLEILWINNCNIINISEWLLTIQAQFPRLKQLSMMCNPVGLTVLNGVSDTDESEYRLQVIRILPSLEFFDGAMITDRHRRMARENSRSLHVLEEALKKTFKSLLDLSLTTINRSLMVS